MWLQTKQTEFNSSQNRQTAAHRSSFWYRYCAQVDTTVLSRKNKNNYITSIQPVHTHTWRDDYVHWRRDRSAPEHCGSCSHWNVSIILSCRPHKQTSGFYLWMHDSAPLDSHFKQSPPPFATGLPICTMSSVIFHEWLQSTPKPSFYKSSVVTSPPQQISVFPEREKQREASHPSDP